MATQESASSHEPRSILVTGGAGFIGSNFVRMVLEEHPDVQIVNLDLLTYAGNLDNLEDVLDNPRHQLVKGSILDTELVSRLLDTHKVDSIVHFAAESHVDRSISDPDVFIETNVTGTVSLLKSALASKAIERFVQVGTDEVYGSLTLHSSEKFRENSPIAPNSPYSASKTSADLFCFAWYHTYGLPVMVTRCSNNYGPYHFPEKLIPLMILRAIRNQPLPVYGDGLNVRDWIYVRDHCAGVWTVLTKGKVGEVYNIGANEERPNIEVVRLILDTLGKPYSLVQHVQDRPGHDRRYAIDASKIMRELGWKPQVTFAEGIQRTIDWYLNNKRWLERIESGAYRQSNSAVAGEA